MNRLSIVCLVLLLAAALPPQQIVDCSHPDARTRCVDGSCSASTGQGTCSSHGGVAGPVEVRQPAPAPTATPVQQQAAPAPEPTRPPQPAPQPENMPASGVVLPGGSDTVVLVLGAGLVLVLLAGGYVKLRS
jgi:hypothetical protein